MPLLGRHKSIGGASPSSTGSNSSSSSSSSSSAAAGASGRQRQQVCESPLFGVRKQLPLGSSPPGGSHQGTKTPTSGGGSASAINELSSVPQQITSQQIHYAFAIMDTNKDGMIDLRDLSQMLANLGVPIDEAILSHIMSTVSKRGDHRISEAEFLDWISHFIQISDSATTTTSKTGADSTGSCSSTVTKATKRLERGTQGGGATGSTNKTRVARSSTAGSSLAAAPSEVPRARRGSGSGLALMRSLSSSASSPSSAASAAPSGATRLSDSGGSASGVTGKSSRTGNRNHNQQQQQQQTPSADSEARSDLKAAFCVFDLDGDGYITFDEVRAGLKLMGESWSPNELRHLFGRCSSSSLTASQASSPSDLSRQRISIDDFVQLLL